MGVRAVAMTVSIAKRAYYLTLTITLFSGGLWIYKRNNPISPEGNVELLHANHRKDHTSTDTE